MTETHNKGTGAGGSKTNHNGNAFEMKTDNEPRLILNGYVRKDIPGNKNKKTKYYYEKIDAKRTIHYVKKKAFEKYMFKFHQKKPCREPDEAYIVIDNSTGNITIKILEKKNQNRDGSVEDKLLNGHYFKFDEYPHPRCLGDKFQVEYAFCISAFLKKKYNSDKPKWEIIKESNQKYNIPVLFGDDDDYFSKLDEWINS